MAADGSAAPTAITTEGQPLANVSWNADNGTLYLMSGASLMQAAMDGSAPGPAFAQVPARAVSISRDGTRVAYVAGGIGSGAGRGRGRGGRGTGTGDVPAASGPAEIRVKSLIDGAEKVVSTVDGPVGGVAWAGDGHRTITVGGGAPANASYCL